MELALVCMAAGISSRFGGRIKAFASVGPKGESLIEYLLQQALPTGFSKITFIVGRATENIFKEKFGEEYKSLKVQYVLQEYDKTKRDRPWGTVDAICSALPMLNCPFVVCNGDDIYDSKDFAILVGHLRSKESEAMIGYRLGDMLSNSGGVNRGIVKTFPDGKVMEIKETFNMGRENLLGYSGDDLCSMNIFAMHPKTLELLNLVLKDFKNKYSNDRIKECLLPEELSKLTKEKKIIMEVYPAQGKWFGVTYLEDEAKIREEIKKDSESFK